MKLFIIGAVIAIIAITQTVYFYKNCEGTVVRGIIGLECIK